MVCVAVCPAHCSGVMNVLQITLTGDDIVNEMPMFGSRMHPRVLMSWLMFEAGIGDG